MTHAMLAFEYPGGWNDVKGSTAVTVLQFLLGGGGSFSAGGPGKRSHSISMHAPHKRRIDMFSKSIPPMGVLSSLHRCGNALATAKLGPQPDSLSPLRST